MGFFVNYICVVVMSCKKKNIYIYIYMTLIQTSLFLSVRQPILREEQQINLVWPKGENNIIVLSTFSYDILQGHCDEVFHV